MTTTALHPAPLAPVVGPTAGPSLDDIEAWLAEVRPPLCSLRDSGGAPTPGARRWLAGVAAEADAGLTVLDHECQEATICGQSPDAVEWLHTRVAAVADVVVVVLARQAHQAHQRENAVHPTAA